MAGLSLGYRRREQLSVICLGLCGLLIVATYLPPFAYLLWMVRFFARELALFASGLSLGAIALVLKPPPVDSAATRRWPLLLGCLLFPVSALPVVATLPTFARLGIGFSLRQYVTVASPSLPAGQVIEDRDVVLVPERPDLRVDVYRPAASKSTGSAAALNGAAVVVVHGGSFQRGDKGDVPQVSRALAGSGFAVFDLRYRLAPQSPFPAAVQDILCIVGRLAAPPAQQSYGIDGTKVALLGRSAGGTLVLSAAYAAALQGTATQDPPSGPARVSGCSGPTVVPAAVVAIYPWTDLQAVYANPPSPDPLDTRQVMEAYLGGPSVQRPALYAQASPLRDATARVVLPKTLLIHGQADTLVPPQQSVALARALGEAGQSVSHLAIPFAEHGFDHRPGGAAEQLARERTQSFLIESLRNAQSANSHR